MRCWWHYLFKNAKLYISVDIWTNHEECRSCLCSLFHDIREIEGEGLCISLAEEVCNEASHLLHESFWMETAHYTESYHMMIDYELLLLSTQWGFLWSLHFEFCVLCYSLYDGLSNFDVFFNIVFPMAFIPKIIRVFFTEHVECISTFEILSPVLSCCITVLTTLSSSCIRIITYIENVIELSLTSSLVHAAFSWLYHWLKSRGHLFLQFFLDFNILLRNYTSILVIVLLVTTWNTKIKESLSLNSLHQRYQVFWIWQYCLSFCVISCWLTAYTL